MLLERRTVSRKTPGDGRLEITHAVAEELRGRAPALEVELHGARAPGHVETMACTCAKSGAPHEHHFLTSELLKSLHPAADVELHLLDSGEAGGRARVAVTPVA
jgi:hypothetical protein